jgi:arylsulfatase
MLVSVAQKPNIILINMDDMGYGDTEPYGSTGYATPNFNRLAKEGMRFTHFYAAQAVCSPSRAALLTGCYPNRIGMSGGALMPWSKKALNPNEATIAGLLKKAGYKTAMFGKWHLGATAPYLPLHYGFDQFYGIPYSHDMWPVDYEGKPITDTSDWRIRVAALPVIDGDKQVASINTLAGQATLTATLTRKAEEFIAANKQKPFFLYLAHPMPHVPLAASPAFAGKTGAGLYADVISEIDWSVGRIIDLLDKTGLSKNTMLIVTSDNGPWLSFGNHAGSSGGLREGKGTAWDGGTRVPCFVRWPGKIGAGSICAQLLTNMDILPTIVAATGASLPKEKIDGLNFLPVLTGKTNQSPRELFYVYYDANNLKLIRYKNWELVLPHSSQSYSQGQPGKDGKPGPVPAKPVPMALYDLIHDPGTVYDVQKLYPEVVQQMLGYAEQAREDLGDDLTNRKGKNIRPSATLKE